jgi:hypothetical protein
VTLVRGTLKLRTNITGNCAKESRKGGERMKEGEEDVKKEGWKEGKVIRMSLR